MDFQTLTNLFSTSFNPDPNVRMAGELEIRKVSAQSREREAGKLTCECML